jgi:hypothetical protein
MIQTPPQYCQATQLKGELAAPFHDIKGGNRYTNLEVVVGGALS